MISVVYWRQLTYWFSVGVANPKQLPEGILLNYLQSYRHAMVLSRSGVDRRNDKPAPDRLETIVTLPTSPRSSLTTLA